MSGLRPPTPVTAVQEAVCLDGIPHVDHVDVRIAKRHEHVGILIDVPVNKGCEGRRDLSFEVLVDVVTLRTAKFHLSKQRAAYARVYLAVHQGQVNSDRRTLFESAQVVGMGGCEPRVVLEGHLTLERGAIGTIQIPRVSKLRAQRLNEEISVYSVKEVCRVGG